MKLLKSILVVSLCLGVTVLTIFAGQTAHAQALHTSTTNCGSWSIDLSPSPYRFSDYLNGVSAISATDVWAVGYGQKSMVGNTLTLTEHWDGTSWNVIPSSKSRPIDGDLLSVAAVSTNDVWAVGAEGLNALIIHWNGKNWKMITNPGKGTLLGVTAISASDIWAVGTSNGGTLIEHWNGTNWSIVPSPAIISPASTTYTLASVTAISAKDVWAVGYIYTVSGPNYTNQTLIEHWNGSKWKIVQSLNRTTQDTLTSVTAVSAGNVWAVGISGLHPTQTLTENWNGSQWSIVASSNPSGIQSYFKGAVAVSASNVWAVGGYLPSSTLEPLIEQWNGTQWNVVPSPTVGTRDNELDGVAATSDNHVWAVGYSQNHNGGSPTKTLIESYC
ncbi:MAG TPA: hypothetical protein VKR42_05040 [Ktedonobacteraceae bacterium]|nr:hypothetical protein [Ktedonobacteraceae bacterium]